MPQPAVQRSKTCVLLRFPEPLVEDISANRYLAILLRWEHQSAETPKSASLLSSTSNATLDNKRFPNGRKKSLTRGTALQKKLDPRYD
jgi:hypothetical protein